MSDSGAGSKVSYFLAGLGIGALVGILFAPKSGEETREYLTSKADEGRDYAQRLQWKPARTHTGAKRKPSNPFQGTS
jgi:gas vesicle protein